MSTYCNPLPLPNYPRGRYADGSHDAEYDGWRTGVRRDFRETADPSVIYEAGRYILYSSAGMAWTSDDGGATWQHRPIEPYDIGYAPTVVKHAGRYLLTACHASVWASDNPLGPFEELGPIRAAGGGELEPAAKFYDPMLFSDDDGRLFVYWGLADDGIKGVELDEDDPTRAITEREVMFAYDPDHVWERFGEFNEDASKSFVEGPWMLKAAGRYYLTYTAPGTEFASYGMGAYVADTPLGPFRYQRHNPICESRHGLIRGAGHGCVIHGHADQLWAFFTCGAQTAHNFERRVGMAPARIDEHGELRVGPVNERPMPISGGNVTAGLLPVNRAKAVSASSVAPGRDPSYANDGDLRTWWQPAEDDAIPRLVSRFDGRFSVSSTRLAWAEPGLNYDAGRVPKPIAFTLELRDGERADWEVVADNRGGAELLIDYRTFAPTVATQARVTVHASPGYAWGIADMSVFGVGNDSVATR
ncbi:MAG: family 43 glycosylhydrolase [Planctomycetota bacterium]